MMWPNILIRDRTKTRAGQAETVPNLILYVHIKQISARKMTQVNKMAILMFAPACIGSATSLLSRNLST